MNVNRDKNVLDHIEQYCDQIGETVALFGSDYNVFSSNNTYRNACCMCLLQIGELTNVLSDDFKDTHPDIPWKQIKGFRNIVAHAYGTIEAPIVWDIVTTDIPELKDYCRKCLEEQ